MARILVVDDEESIRQLYKAELEDEGYEVITANDGESALQTLEQDKDIDLITVDIRMPKMDGLELVGKIREKDKKLPIVICSAYPSYKQDFHAWGAGAYVVKSSEMAELKEKVKELLTQE